MKRERHYRGGYRFAGLLELARTLRSEQTSAESFLWQLLRNRQFLGLKFRRQHQFGDYVVDFFCREVQLSVMAARMTGMNNGTMTELAMLTLLGMVFVCCGFQTNKY